MLIKSTEKIRGKVLFYNVLLFLLFDLRTYLGELLPLNVISAVYFICPLATFLLFISSKSKTTKLNSIGITTFYYYLIFLFLILYGLRMFHNLVIFQYDAFVFHNEYTYFIYLIFFILIPLYIIKYLDSTTIDIKKILDVSLILFFICLVISFIKIFSRISWGEFFALRFSANEDLDTISYGHLGLTFMFITVCRIKLEKLKLKSLLFGVVFAFISLFTMAVANSRSPFLALIGVLMFYFVSLGKIKYIVVFFIALLLLFFNISFLDEVLQQEFSLTFLERIRIVLETGSDGYDGKTSRTALFEYGLNIFLQNPITGSSFLLHNAPAGNGSNVHNIFIESFMALGLLGGSLFLILNVVAIYRSYILIKFKSKYLIFGLLFIQFLILGITSRCLINLPNYWYMMGAVLIFSKQVSRNKKLAF